jgi:hypothetical protein
MFLREHKDKKYFENSKFFKNIFPIRASFLLITRFYLGLIVINIFLLITLAAYKQYLITRLVKIWE